MKRTHYCGNVVEKFISENVIVFGWVHSRRDHGGVIFIDLRDRTGVVQVVFGPDQKEIFANAEKIRSEFVLKVCGVVRQRPAGTINPNIPSGSVEIVCSELEVINTCPSLPFEISDYTETSEELRLKYRYLDLRRPAVQKNFILRHKITHAARNFLNENGFIEIETPMLTKSTPEGARDFLVPARQSPGMYFALPQSPQLYKQILMVSGFDRYYQVARCFRDEDLRADRQPEFTQIDLELSFADEKDIMKIIEGMLKVIFDVVGISITTPFPLMPYAHAMLRYGSDKPDIRFDMEIEDFTQDLANCGFKVFSSVVQSGGVVRGICFEGGAKASRSDIEELTKFVANFGARGLAWIKHTEAGYESSIVKFFTPDDLVRISNKFNSKPGSLWLFLADNQSIVAQGLGALRIKIAKENAMIPPGRFDFLWVTDFPLLEWDSEEKRWNAMHHPFTSPKEEDFALLDDTSKGADLRARAYDVVLNGVELGGGSIRIHRKEIQEKMFSLINTTPQQAKEKFGFLLDALSYGAPPHGGIALGLDRLCALIAGEESIREVIAFPKTQKGSCPLSGAPALVSEKQLKELGIKPVSIIKNNGS
ncbi:MAG: aspartate--tRNA ligase [Endomicrobiales bacterium]|nr:aspartate--tRNA ligase [Endomicrobiales bacterium]